MSEHHSSANFQGMKRKQVYPAAALLAWMPSSRSQISHRPYMWYSMPLQPAVSAQRPLQASKESASTKNTQRWLKLETKGKTCEFLEPHWKNEVLNDVALYKIEFLATADLIKQLQYSLNLHVLSFQKKWFSKKNSCVTYYKGDFQQKKTAQPKWRSAHRSTLRSCRFHELRGTRDLRRRPRAQSCHQVDSESLEVISVSTNFPMDFPPRKIKGWNLKTHPIEKDHHLNQTIMTSGSMLIFQVQRYPKMDGL